MFASVSLCVISFGVGRRPCPGEGFRAVFGQIFGGFSSSAEDENKAPAEAQRSGFGGKRRRSGMSKFSPFSAETSGMELAVTKSRIKGWRRNRRSAQSLLPAVRAVDGGFNAGGCGAF